MVVLVSDDDAVDQMLTKQRGRFRQGSIGGACDQPFVHELANGAHWKPAQIGVVIFNGKTMNTMPEWRRHVPIPSSRHAIQLPLTGPQPGGTGAFRQDPPLP